VWCLALVRGLSQGNRPAYGVQRLLVGALVAYAPLAILMVLAIRPRTLPRDTGYAVDCEWREVTSLYRRHHRALRERAQQLDDATKAKAVLVTIGPALLAVEVSLLTLAIVVGLVQ
jgi:hypothetical protein